MLCSQVLHDCDKKVKSVISEMEQRYEEDLKTANERFKRFERSTLKLQDERQTSSHQVKQMQDSVKFLKVRVVAWVHDSVFVL